MLWTRKQIWYLYLQLCEIWDKKSATFITAWPHSLPVKTALCQSRTDLRFYFETTEFSSYHFTLYFNYIYYKRTAFYFQPWYGHFLSEFAINRLAFYWDTKDKNLRGTFIWFNERPRNWMFPRAFTTHYKDNEQISWGAKPCWCFILLVERNVLFAVYSVCTYLFKFNIHVIQCTCNSTMDTLYM